MTDILKLLSHHIYHNPGHDYTRAMIDAKEEIERLRHERQNLRRSWADERAEVKRLRAALIRLRDCDWVITLPDRMDAVRDIARAALEGATVDDKT